MAFLTAPYCGNIYFVLILFCLLYLLRGCSGAVCTYTNCEPVEEFLASPNIPTIIGPNCATCNECARLKFSTCTLVHTKDETGSHCACGNTLPTICGSDAMHLDDILDFNATRFLHDYMCTFSKQLDTAILPPLEMIKAPKRINDTAVIKIPLYDVVGTRRYNDLKINSISLYLLNDSDTEYVGAISDRLFEFEPLARIHFDPDGIPLMIEPDDPRFNMTNWPELEFPIQGTLPSTIAYVIDRPFHRFIKDPMVNSTVRNVSFWYSSMTSLHRDAYYKVTDYTKIVLIVAGVILGLGLCCACISCKDKLKHRRYRKTIEGEVAARDPHEFDKSIALSNHPQMYTAIKNGGHTKAVIEEPEEQNLLLSSERQEYESATLPMTNASKDKYNTDAHAPSHGQSFPTVIAASPRSRPTDMAIAEPKTDTFKRRSPTVVENDRRKFLNLMKETTVIRAADLDLLESIGAGEFGIIRRGYVFDRTEAMIHCLRPPHKQATDTAAESLIEKLDGSVRPGFHPHIISILGICQEADVLYVCLQLETGPNLRNMLRESRSLDQFLQYTNARGRLSLISPQRLLNIILGIARGMGHLEECQVLHDNLASVNIVICDNGTPKIGGFGMATMSDLYMRQMEKNHDQLRWLPPETHDTGLFTMKSQTWSFGVVLWEIVTFGGTPYFEMSDDEVVERVANGYRLIRPTNCSKQLYDLMEQCWMVRGEDRPDFMAIQQHIHELNLDPELHISVTYHEGFKYQPIKETWNT